MNETFTGTSSTREPIKLNLGDLAALAEKTRLEYQELLLNSFKDIPVRVDESLDGFQYYISVSPELKSLLQQKYGPTDWPENEIIREDKAE